MYGCGESQPNPELFLMCDIKQKRSAPMQLGGIYVIERVLQKAIFGEVLLVKSSSTGKAFVLKAASKALLHRRYSAGGSNVFEDYRRELTVLDASRGNPHPNLLATAPLAQQLPDRSSTIQYTTLPYLHGGELFARVDEDGAMGDTLETRQLCRGIAEGLNHLHSKLQYSHNDVSLENILLTSKGLPVVCDFGLALPIGAPWDPKRCMSGKMQYQAPEIYECTQKHASSAADIYSLGVTMFVLLTGIPPFDLPDQRQDQRFKYVQQGHMGQLLDLWQMEVSPGAVNLMSGMLIADPVRRMTMAQVLAHPWMTEGLHSVGAGEELREELTDSMEVCGTETFGIKTPLRERATKCGDSCGNMSSSPSSVFSFERAFKMHEASTGLATISRAGTAPPPLTLDDEFTIEMDVL